MNANINTGLLAVIAIAQLVRVALAWRTASAERLAHLAAAYRLTRPNAAAGDTAPDATAQLGGKGRVVVSP